MNTHNHGGMPERVLVVKKIQVALRRIPRSSEYQSALLTLSYPLLRYINLKSRSGVEVLLTKENTAELMIPIFTSRVQAGFPSPADDHLEDALDLNTHLIQHKDATFLREGAGRFNAGCWYSSRRYIDSR